jgi:Clostripain family
VSARSKQDSTSENQKTEETNQIKESQSATRLIEPRPKDDASPGCEEGASEGKKSHDSSAQSHYPTTTLMIYLAGDNNLSDECIYALTELKLAKASDRVRILAQYDPGDEFLPTQRYRINRYGADRCRSPLAEDLIDQFPFCHESPKQLHIRPPYGERRERRGEGGTGDPKMLYNFVAFCVDRYPKTDHYVLIICGHGAGVQRDFLLRDNRPDGNLTIHELRYALRMMQENLTGKDPRKKFKLDILGMDVCLMSMAEITYELRGLVDIAIGCESYSPAAGWPYRQTVQHIDGMSYTNKRLYLRDWEDVARDIVKAYVRFYSDYWLGGLSVSMSALRVREVERLESHVRALALDMLDELKNEADKKKAKHENEESEHHEKLMNCREDDFPTKDKWKTRHPRLLFSDALVLAHWRAQSYNGELYVDIADFAKCLAEYAPYQIARSCYRLARFIECEFKIISCYFGRNYQYSHGVSIYFPWSSLVPYYGASIDFPSDSKWIAFLKTYIEVTRRDPRRIPICFENKQRREVGQEQLLQRKLRFKNLADVRMGSDRMGSDRMGYDEGGNPISSMRNPPIVFNPDCCLDDYVRFVNAYHQQNLMHDVELDELLPDPKVQAFEARTPARTLLNMRSPIEPPDLESGSDDNQ